MSNYVHTTLPSQPPLSMYSSSLHDQREESLVDPWLPSTAGASADVSQPTEISSNLSKPTYSPSHAVSSTAPLNDPTRRPRSVHTPGGSPSARQLMASVVSVPDDNKPSSSLPVVPSPGSSVDSSHLPPPPSTSSTTDNHVYLSPITPILKSARNSLDSSGSTTHTSDNSSLPPPPTPTLTAHSFSSILWANSTVSRDNDPEEHDGSRSLYLPSHPRGHRRKGSIGTVSSIGSSSTERDAEDRSSPLQSAHSGVTRTLPLLTLPRLHTTSDAGSRSSSIIHRAAFRARRPRHHLQVKKRIRLGYDAK